MNILQNHVAEKVWRDDICVGVNFDLDTFQKLINASTGKSVSSD